MFQLRDESKYGKFKANSSIGDIIFHRYIYGWGEGITIYALKGDKLCSATNDPSEDDYFEGIIEEDDYLIVKPSVYESISINLKTAEQKIIQ